MIGVSVVVVLCVIWCRISAISTTLHIKIKIICSTEENGSTLTLSFMQNNSWQKSLINFDVSIIYCCLTWKTLTFTDSAVKQKTMTISANCCPVSILLLSYLTMIVFGNFHKTDLYCTKYRPNPNNFINIVFFHNSNFGKF